MSSPKRLVLIGLGSLVAVVSPVAGSPVTSAGIPSCLAECLDGAADSLTCSSKSLFNTAVDCFLEACRTAADQAHALAALDTRCAAHDLRRRQSKLVWRQTQEGGGYVEERQAQRREEDKWNLNLALVLFGLIAVVILIGLCQHLALSFDNWRLKRRIISNRRPASGPPGLFRRTRSWVRGRLLLPAAFGWRHLSPFLGLGTIPTRLNFLLVALYILLNLVFSVVDLRGHNHGFSLPTIPSLEQTRYIADRTGYLAVANMPLFFLFAGKTKFLQTLTGWSGSTFAVFHKWIARTCIVLALIHSISYAVIRSQVEGQDTSMRFNPVYWRNGILATSVLVFMQLVSLLPMRTLYYELFVMLHVVSGVLFLVFVAGHLNLSVSKAYHPYVYACIGFWAQDRLYRLFRLLQLSIGSRHQARISRVHDTSIIKLTVYPSKDVDFFPGAHYYIYFQGLFRLYESHPFTAVSYRESYKTEKRNRRKLTFLIKPRGGLTASLGSMIRRHSKHARINVLLEGPYGNHHPLSTYSTVVLIAGGIGISASIPHIKSYCQRRNKRDKSLATEKIILFWSAPEYNLMAQVWKRELLPFVMRKEGRMDPSIEVLFYVTNHAEEIGRGGAYRDRKAAMLACEDEMAMAGVDVRFCRGSVRDLVRCEISKEEREPSGRVRSLAFMVCGPAGLVDDAREMVAEGVAKGVEGVGYFEESFGT